MFLYSFFLLYFVQLERANDGFSVVADYFDRGVFNKVRNERFPLSYHDPGADGALLLDHLFYTLTLAESKYPNCGIIVTGDFNRLDVTRLLNHFRLKQIVKIPTRNDVTLDL